MSKTFDIVLVMPRGTEVSGERFLRAQALLSYPENYVKAHATLERAVQIYMKAEPRLQVLTGNYLKAAPLLQKEVFPYIKFDVAFPEASGRYLKSSASMQARGDQYIRAYARFVMHANYLKVKAALVTQPIIGDIGNNPPANKKGLLSREYLSVASVKKEV